MMNPKMWIVMPLVLLAGCASTTWQARTFSDHESIGRVLFDGTGRMKNGQLRPIDLASDLGNKRVVFVDDDGQRIAVRDIAFGILEEAGIEGLPAGSAPVFICGCKVGGEWYRFHIPHLSDEEFGRAIKTIQQGGGQVR